MDYSQKENDNESYNAPTESMWKEFLNNTTLHGVRNVVSSRKKFIRTTWLILLLALGTYYLLSVYTAFEKYLQYPVTTTMSMTYTTKMAFPAVTICPNNLFSKAKVMMRDENPAFSAQGLNLSVCAATRDVRESNMSNLACGMAMICCCVYLGFPLDAGYIANCTEERGSTLRHVLQQSGVNFNMEDFFLHYSADITDLLQYSSMCTFSSTSTCNTSDFVRKHASSGFCYTFNSEKTDTGIRNFTLTGLTGGFSLMLKANYSDEVVGKFSRGFKVIIHKQGVYFDDWEGISLSPGTHASIIVSEQKLTNLPSPYGKCQKASLKSYPSYTLKGCIFECLAERAIKFCGCRMAGYSGSKHETVCWLKHAPCLRYNASDYETCGNCSVPCSLVKYRAEVSYSKFPDMMSSRWFYDDIGDIEEQSKSLTFLQVGMKTVGYEEQIQTPAYDIRSLFGEIGGNMGLFLGCSVLTICEFLEFLISFVAARLCTRQVDVSPA